MNTIKAKVTLSDFDKEILNRITEEVKYYDIYWNDEQKTKYSTFKQIENEDLRNLLIDNYQGAWIDEDGYYHPDAEYSTEQQQEKEEHNEAELKWLLKLNEKFNN